MKIPIKVKFSRPTKFVVPIFNFNTKIIPPDTNVFLTGGYFKIDYPEWLLDWEDINKQFKEGASQ